MASTRTVFVFNKDEAQLQEIQNVLRDIPGIQVQVMPAAHILEGKLALPFIEVDDAGRFFGLESIRRFAQRLVLGTEGTR